MSDHTATAVERLVAAGMIPLGKTHMVEFAFGGWGRNQPMGAPWNPWDTRIHRVAGGSSSGSAVAVAGGLVPAAIGSDTGGSVRIPAALCGLTGLKTTYGLVSLHGAVPLSPTLDSIGPLAHTVEDAALLTAAMAGPDPRDPATLAAPRFDLDAALAGPPDIRGMRIACLAPEHFPAYTLPDVVRARDEAIAVLRDRGRDRRRAAGSARLRGPDGAQRPADRRRSLCVPSRVHRRRVAADRRLGAHARAVGQVDQRRRLHRRARRCERAPRRPFAEWMRGRDALLTPTLPITATPIADIDESTTPLATFTRAANYLGACALSLPAGFSPHGLPIGVQLIGAPFAEATLIRIGRAFQAATDWHLRRPAL